MGLQDVAGKDDRARFPTLCARALLTSLPPGKSLPSRVQGPFSPPLLPLNRQDKYLHWVC